MSESERDDYEPGEMTTGEKVRGALTLAILVGGGLFLVIRGAFFR